MLQRLAREMSNVDAGASSKFVVSSLSCLTQQFLPVFV
jgi:hypothetical protein